ncbi:MAG: 5-formyltetrahydrofolate cyclo-ligase [Alphaproteobacteria bacterium]|nr:5-formyltetrahydrofolate cyclo-ligase [Alphaproteobacteria bacterium]TAD91437.1 MAG: 5-formyltetrahydrofolate cyclo-ligase [Alphaproteobacteria bacterium]
MNPWLVAAKSALRSQTRTRRKALPLEVRAAAAAAIADRLGGLDLPAGAMVAGYAAAGSELDPSLALARLAARGHPLCLPVVVERDQPLEFHTWRPGEPLVPGNGARVPLGGALALPDVLLVPLIAFDERLRRLGQGGGYYDRTVPALRRIRPLLAIGIGFATQQVPLVPGDARDIVLDLVVTEDRLVTRAS